jgi:hypothetical protein
VFKFAFRNKEFGEEVSQYVILYKSEGKTEGFIHLSISSMAVRIPSILNSCIAAIVCTQRIEYLTGREEHCWIKPKPFGA